MNKLFSDIPILSVFCEGRERYPVDNPGVYLECMESDRDPSLCSGLRKDCFYPRYFKKSLADVFSNPGNTPANSLFPR